MSPQWTGRRRKSSLRSCQYPGHTLVHIGKITTVAGRHVVNFQIANEISQSFVPSRKYHFFFSSCKKFFKNASRLLFFFWSLYPLEQCAPSHLFTFNLLYHPPSLPTVPPLFLQAFVLKGVKFLPYILISEKLSPSTFSLNS